MEEIPTMCVIFVVVVLTTFTECKITTLNYAEGDMAFLNFSYSCNSSEVTLRHDFAAPFYNSRNPSSSSLPSNLKLRNETNGEICFLYLTINPVSRDDQGGYILLAYKNGRMQHENDRIVLVIAYPPGKAACTLSEEYIDQDWVRLQCTAPIGSVKGFITCYQSDVKIPPLTAPQEGDETLSQTLLAKVGDLVYCCSSTLDHTKDRCDCKDSLWDPSQNKQVTNVTEPCTPTLTTVQYPPCSQHPIEDNELELTSPSTKALTDTPQQSNFGKVLEWINASFFLFNLIFFILNVTFYCWYFKRHQKRHPKKHPNLKTEIHVEEPFVSDVKV